MLLICNTVLNSILRQCIFQEDIKWSYSQIGKLFSRRLGYELMTSDLLVQQFTSILGFRASLTTISKTFRTDFSQMTEFCRKSLATSEYDMTLDCYVYTVHDLQLEYLKSLLKDDEDKEKVINEKQISL